MKKTSLHFEQTQQHLQWSYKRCILLLLLIVGFLLSGCQGPLPKDSAQQTSIANSSVDELDDDYNDDGYQPTLSLKPQKPQLKPEQATDLWQRIRLDLRFLDYEHPRISHEIQRLQRNPGALNILLSRSEPYLHYIIEQVEHHNLPREIALLPAVESGFRPFAYSRNGAAGLWQFMPATGRMLGLHQHWWYDGRRDVTSSTKAALKYLMSLNKRLDGNWLYALAAYNAGAGTVGRAIRKARKNNQPEDYWSLKLPTETRDYIPRLIALAKVIKDPVKYGVSLPKLANRPYFAVTESRKQIDLQVAADLADVTLQDFLNLNPAFNRGVTHPDSNKRLLVPVNKRLKFNAALAALPDNHRLRWRQHKIRRGETLIKIARQYNVTVNSIRQANKISGSRIRINQNLLIPLSQTTALAQIQRKIPKPKVRYRVRKGDSLYAIARKFQVKIADLKRWNKVNKYLRPGQQLTVYVNPT